MSSSDKFLETAEFLFLSLSGAQTSSTVKSTKASPKCIEVQIKGIPIRGIIDTDSDIINVSVFREIAAARGLKKQQFKPANQKACTFGHHPLELDG